MRPQWKFPDNQLFFSQKTVRMMSAKCLLMIAVLALICISQNIRISRDNDSKGKSCPRVFRADSLYNNDKCKTVKCTADTICFNGRCKKRNGCESIQCPVGFGCDDGICIPQKISPEKKICKSPMKRNDKVEITGDVLAKCKKAAKTAVCGFNSKKELKEYASECDVCADRSVKYFFRSPCQGAPVVCGQNQECINGKCLLIFDEEDFDDCILCNSSSDCKKGETCMGHKCLNKKDAFNYLTMRKTTSI